MRRQLVFKNAQTKKSETTQTTTTQNNDCRDPPILKEIPLGHTEKGKPALTRFLLEKSKL